MLTVLDRVEAGRLIETWLGTEIAKVWGDEPWVTNLIVVANVEVAADGVSLQTRVQTRTFQEKLPVVATHTVQPDVPSQAEVAASVPDLVAAIKKPLKELRVTAGLETAPPAPTPAPGSGTGSAPALPPVPAEAPADTHTPALPPVPAEAPADTHTVDQPGQQAF
ncbi:hypothetical protein [Kitasatospora viridis]|uniref:Uncharacterized protein n=1 Tax=Kitasatospora viridis TaxID=281105 RepID=A0A561S9Y5_9ACTN|nr:hypothetical protein [Kitasatospora viridis]TWF71657.1 hypothetical protein FHX73_1828 [Kitasatospora viridis]